MAEVRFPKARFVRTLESLIDEIQTWREDYLRQYQLASDERRGVAAEERATQLHDVEIHLWGVIDELENLRRLS